MELIPTPTRKSGQSFAFRLEEAWCGWDVLAARCWLSTFNTNHVHLRTGHAILSYPGLDLEERESWARLLSDNACRTRSPPRYALDVRTLTERSSTHPGPYPVWVANQLTLLINCSSASSPRSRSLSPLLPSSPVHPPCNTIPSLP